MAVGVEELHYFVVRDLGWTGGVDVARRVHAILERRELVSVRPELFDLHGGGSRKLRDRLMTLQNPPTNLLVDYPHVDGGRAVAEVMGPSYYASVKDRSRYFKRISVLIGTNSRIGPSPPSLNGQVIRPPLQSGREVHPHPE